MKNKKTRLAVLARVLVAGVLAAADCFTRPKAQAGGKTFTVTVVHSDGTEREFTYTSDQEYLGAVLQAEGLVTGTPGEFGLYMDSVDGETASWEENGAYWAFYEGEDYATASIDLTPITDGAAYKLVYTLG